MIIKSCDKERSAFSKEIEIEYLNRFNESEIDIHSLLVYKDQELIYERYFGFIDTPKTSEIPNSEYALQRVYSITKSFISIAVGLMIDEGRLRLEDKIVDYYELLTGKKSGSFDEYMSKVTIENMLTMTSNHSKTTYKLDYSKNWVESFFDTISDKEPGRGFNYESAGCHVLTSLIEKLSGMTVMDYLRSKMPELNISKEAYIMKDPFDVEMGGTGLMCTSRDLLKFAILIKNKGTVDGRQLISRDYLDRACSKLVDNSSTAKFPFEGCGYGYFFWQHEHEGYMCYGMNGQLIYFAPKKKMIVITTADTSKTKEGIQRLLDIVNELSLRIG